MGGLSLLLFTVVLASGESSFSVSTLALTAAWSFNWVINYPHFVATLARLYRKEERIKHLWVAYALPLAFVPILAAGWAWPDQFGSYLVKTFLVWSAYHFGAQTFGLTLLYAARLNFSFSIRDRYLLRAAIVSAFVHQWVYLESTGPSTLFQSIAIPLLNLPKVVPQFSFAIATMLFLASFLSPKNKVAFFQTKNWIIPLPLIAYGTWFLWGSRLNSFQTMVPFFHSLQYLVFTASLVRPKEKMKWAGMIIGGGFFLFALIPMLGDFFAQSRGIAFPLVVATVQIHHFIVDGILWRLKDPAIRAELIPSASAAIEVPTTKRPDQKQAA